VSEPDPSFTLYNRSFHKLRVKCGDVLARRSPRLLYHYTSAAGLQGIIESGSLFLADSAFLNDRSELTYARDLIVHVLNAKANRAPTEVHRRFMTLAAGYLSSGTDVMRSFRCYLACFCARGNQLSQWRAYGRPGSGFAIGFRSSGLRAGTVQLQTEHSLSLIPVEYRRRVQERVIGDAVDIFFEELAVATHRIDKKASTSTLTNMFPSLPILLGILLPVFKHPVFAEEREWRLVARPLADEVRGFLRFRESNGTIIPFLVAKFKGRAAAQNRLPLASVTHAPSPEPELRKISVCELLTANSYKIGKVPVNGSDIPLRFV